MPDSPKFSVSFDRKAYSNVLKVFDICLELPSDSEKYFRLVVDEFSELVHTRKLRCWRHLKLLVARPTSQKHRISHSNVLKELEDCLQLLSD